MKEAILNVTETEYLLFSKKQDRLVWTTRPGSCWTISGRS